MKGRSAKNSTLRYMRSGDIQSGCFSLAVLGVVLSFYVAL